MRIITGSARGRRLLTLEGEDVRPTTERVKEALFSILQFQIEGRRVLDLFAGSGQLGLEALSRGAERAVFVDSARAAVACVRRNVETLRMDGRCQVLACDWRAAAQRLAGGGFDLVFIDPPYRMENTGEMCAALLDAGALAAACLLVVEHRRGRLPDVDGRFETLQTRRYGDTEITFVRIRQEETP